MDQAPLLDALGDHLDLLIIGIWHAVEFDVLDLYADQTHDRLLPVLALDVRALRDLALHFLDAFSLFSSDICNSNHEAVPIEQGRQFSARAQEPADQPDRSCTPRRSSRNCYFSSSRSVDLGCGL